MTRLQPRSPHWWWFTHYEATGHFDPIITTPAVYQMNDPDRTDELIPLSPSRSPWEWGYARSHPGR